MKKHISLIQISFLLLFCIKQSYAQNPDTLGWSGPGSAVLNYNNTCNTFGDITCLGSGTATPTQFITGVSYEIINDYTNSTCNSSLDNAWLQVWSGDFSSCNTASPLGTPSLNSLSIIPSGGTEYFLTVSSMDANADDNDCGYAKGHDFSGQSAAIRYKQETTITNTTSTADLCSSVGKEITYNLNGPHNNPEVSFEVINNTGEIINNIFYPFNPGVHTIRVRLGECYDDISYESLISETPADFIQGPSKVCEGANFTLEAIGGETLNTTEFEWGTGDIAGQNIIATTTSPQYSPDPIFSDTKFWVRKKGTIAPCNYYTLAKFIEIEVYNDAPSIQQEFICEGEIFNFGGVDYTQTGQYTHVFSTTDIGCDSTVTLDLFVEALPRATFPRDTTICSGQTITLDAGNHGYSYIWNTGDNTRTIDVSTAGTYFVIMESPNGCKNTDTIDIEVINVFPGFEYIHVENLGQKTFQFSIGNPNDIIDVYWHMGDGNIKAGFTVQHTYKEAGNYQVEIEMISECGVITEYISTHVVNVEDKVKDNSKLKWYPNPARNFITIEKLDKDFSVSKILIFDIQGRVILEEDINNSDYYKLDIQKINSGIYHMQFIDYDGKIIHTSPLEIMR